MALVQAILSELENSRGDYLSGESLAQHFAVSREAVWKAISALRAEGYQIQSAPRLGYRLSCEDDKLSVPGIRRHLKAGTDCQIEVYPALSSTNQLIKERALNGACSGLLIAADSQSEGRGRLNRSFFSPAGSGVYFSLLLRPELPALDAVSLTTAAAVAVAEAIGYLAGRECQIKWVNDILLNGHKVAGILTEAALSLENNRFDYAILGIGINVLEPLGGFPEEIAAIAGAVYSQAPPEGGIRNRLIAEIVNRFFDYYKDLPECRFWPEYKRRSIVLGRRVVVNDFSGIETEATVLNLDENCNLLLRYADGHEAWLGSGEVSLHIAAGEFS